MASYPEGLAWGLWQQQSSKSALGPLGQLWMRAELPYLGHQPRASTEHYSSWKTLQMVYLGHPVMQRNHYSGSETAVYDIRNPPLPWTLDSNLESTLPAMKFRNGLIKMTNTGTSTCPQPHRYPANWKDKLPKQELRWETCFLSMRYRGLTGALLL